MFRPYQASEFTQLVRAFNEHVVDPPTIRHPLPNHGDQSQPPQ
jgi:hypothetical protein